MADPKPQDAAVAEDELPYRHDPGISPLWGMPQPPEEPAVAADVYSLVGSGWVSLMEGQNLNVVI